MVGYLDSRHLPTKAWFVCMHAFWLFPLLQKYLLISIGLPTSTWKITGSKRRQSEWERGWERKRCGARESDQKEKNISGWNYLLFGSWLLRRGCECERENCEEFPRKAGCVSDSECEPCLQCKLKKNVTMVESWNQQRQWQRRLRMTGEELYEASAYE